MSKRPSDPAAGTGSPVLERILQASADLVLWLDPEGRITEVRPRMPLGDADLKGWVGRSWAETVLPDTRAKVGQLLEEARATGVSRSRQVNQTLPQGGDVPIACTGVLLEDEGGFLVLGRNLQALSDLQRRLVEAQQALERDYWRLRQMESRYRLLFQRASDALIVVDAESLRIIDVNRSAAQVFGVPARKLTGRILPDDVGLAREEAAEVRRHLEGIRDLGRGESVTFSAPAGGGWRLDGSILRDEREGIILVHLQEVGPGDQGVGAAPPGLSPSLLLEGSPDPLVVVDRGSRVLMANRAFRNLVQASSREEVTGESLGRWLGRPGADMTVLLTNLEKFGEVRLFPTTLHSALGMESEVEISATPIAGSDPEAIGLTIRNVSRRIWAESGGSARRDLSSAVEQLTDQVGKVSLKELVQDTVGIVEAHFIESALKLTDGNRTAAAEILGVSRQSLYTKLRRYDVEGPEGA
jgi:transcriptional regulator PpsR